MCGCNLVTPRFIGGGPRRSSGSLAMLAAMRRASSRVSSPRPDCEDCVCRPSAMTASPSVCEPVVLRPTYL